MDERANECTDEMMPVRVMNVPRMTWANVKMIRNIFQVLSIPRFS